MSYAYVSKLVEAGRTHGPFFFNFTGRSSDQAKPRGAVKESPRRSTRCDASLRGAVKARRCSNGRWAHWDDDDGDDDGDDYIYPGGPRPLKERWL